VSDPSDPSTDGAQGGGGRLSRLHRLGRASWSLLGIIAVACVLAVAFGAISGVLIPLAVAVILAFLLEPVSNFLQRLRFPPALAVVTTLLAVCVIALGSAAVVVWGFVRRWPEIYRQLVRGWTVVVDWGTRLDIDATRLARLRSAVEGHAADVGQGVLGAVAGTFYGALSLVVGVFLGVFFLFFALRDADRFPVWLARGTGLQVAVIEAVVAQARRSVRGYVRGTALTALVTAPIFMVPLVVLRVPLAIPIFLLYFALSFVPYLGAWVTGVFVVLVALGTSGAVAALILAATFVISNGSIQSVVSSWALGTSLRLHPVAVLLATTIGGTVAGLFGMILGAPLVAALIGSTAAIRELRATPSSD
jgi:putative heme transporter